MKAVKMVLGVLVIGVLVWMMLALAVIFLSQAIGSIGGCPAQQQYCEDNVMRYFPEHLPENAKITPNVELWFVDIPYSCVVEVCQDEVVRDGLKLAGNKDTCHKTVFKVLDYPTAPIRFVFGILAVISIVTAGVIWRNIKI